MQQREFGRCGSTEIPMKAKLIVFLIVTALPNQAGCQAHPATPDTPAVTAAAPPPASSAVPPPAAAVPAVTAPAPAAALSARAKKTTLVPRAVTAASPQRKEPRRAGGGSRTAVVQRPAAVAPARAGDVWPQWRGPDRTGVSRETGLLKSWPAEGPRLSWKAQGLGEGMGGLAVSGGRIYTSGDRDGTAWLYALQEADGKQVWKARIGSGGKFGNVFRPSGPRATPTVDGNRLYILSQHGELVSFTTDGREVWRTDYVKDHGGIIPVWGFSESPLVDGDMIICTPGAEDATLMALDKRTGKPIWKCRVPEGPTGNREFFGKSGAAYASVIAANFEGQRQYVQLTATTLVGVAAADGKLLWRYDRPANTHRINCATPIYHDGMVFATSSYDAGGGAVQLSKEAGGAITPKELFFSRRIRNLHGGMVLVDGYLYGSLESGLLTCIEMKTGEVKWDDRRPGKGSVVYADGRLYCRNESKGTVSLVEANPKQYVEHGSFEQPDRTDESAWTHPVIANGKLYLRDQDMLLCYDVKG